MHVRETGCQYDVEMSQIVANGDSHNVSWELK
jgi:hypothetical protein